MHNRSLGSATPLASAGRLARVLLASVLALAAVGAIAPAAAAGPASGPSAPTGGPPPFACGSDAGWLVAGAINAPNGPQNLQLYSVDSETAGLTPIGPGGLDANALAYNPADNYLYGVGYHGGPTASGNRLYRLAADGTAVDLGVPSGLGGNTPERQIFAGTFLPSGNYLAAMNYHRSNDTSVDAVFVEIDVSDNTVQAIWPVRHRNYDYFDLAVDPATGRIYAHRHADGTIVEIAYGTGSATVVNPGPVPFTSAGSSWFTADGAHWFYGDRAGSPGVQNTLFRAADATSTPVMVAVGPDVTGSDGTSCAFAPSLDKTVAPERVVAGAVVTYTYTITNPAPAPLTMSFEDTMEDGRVFVPDSETSTAGGTFSYGNGDATVVAPDLAVPAATWVPGSGVVAPGTATITIAVDTTGVSPGTVHNQAQVTSSNNPDEPIVSNWPGDDPSGDDPDPTPLDIIETGISIEKTVEDPADPGTFGEVADHAGGQAATFGITVTNTGGADLTDVTVDDPLAAACDDGPRTLLVGQSHSYTCTVTDGYDQQTLNLATVTGQPPSGPAINDADTAEVLISSPAITLEKTVYAGHDGRISCPGSDLVAGRHDDPVTYCFTVTNTGATDLDVTLDDPKLDIDHSDMQVVEGELDDLIRGDSVTLAYETTIEEDLVNTATATGTSPTGATTQATDTAAVDEVAPAIRVDKTVYRGHDGGDGCEGDETAYGKTGDQVTYCFVVTNTGDTPLTQLTLADIDLHAGDADMTTISGDLARIEPLGSVTLFLATSLDESMINEVTATGVPTDGFGTPLAGFDRVSADDTASVVVHDPAVTVDKTDYIGHDGGAGCDGGESAVARTGKPITYCFTVTNTGDTNLALWSLVDDDLGIDASQMTNLSGNPAFVPPEGIVRWYLETTIADTLVNNAHVIANPVLAGGADITGLEDVTDTDDASVSVVAPDIRLDKTVYIGHDGGSGCDGSEVVDGFAGDEVTYCFTVTNTGDTALDPVTIEDPQLGLDQDGMHLIDGDLTGLLPGADAHLYVESTLDASLTNRAVATGRPVGLGGAPLPDVGDVTAFDSARVIRLTPSISIDKTVRLGHDGGQACPGGERVTGEQGQPVTYCFVVTNTGGSPLAFVSVADLDLEIVDADMTVVAGDLTRLEPGESVALAYETVIDGALVNTARATAIPIDDDGRPAPGHPQGISAGDDARVDQLRSEIGVAKSISSGPTSNRDGTYTLTYRIRVRNTGQVDLRDLQLTDDLEATFAAAKSFEVDRVSSADLTANWPGFDGTAAGDPNLLTGVDRLRIGATRTVLVTVTVDPGDEMGPYVNTAIARGTTPLGIKVGDLSDSGTDPAPTRSNPGEPGDTGGTDDPVPTTFTPAAAVPPPGDPSVPNPPAADPATGVLPRTGATVGGLVLVALALIGGGRLLVGRRRRQPT